MRAQGVVTLKPTEIWNLKKMKVADQTSGRDPIRIPKSLKIIKFLMAIIIGLMLIIGVLLRIKLWVA